MSSIYNDIARLKWPNYHITGSGPFAVVMARAHKVELVRNKHDAQTLADASCGRVSELNVPRLRRLPGDWEE